MRPGTAACAFLAPLLSLRKNEDLEPVGADFLMIRMIRMIRSDDR